ncbi:acetate uptake transporter [Vibrio gangliei]|uniref:acetate uptake transporter n=1 Tax=Vibrio gangliei TaxID=2077090 RepID=UPI000D01DE35|nr:GPR1/FUN34/YaaH family transporter [Vibrio gangliei]
MNRIDYSPLGLFGFSLTAILVNLHSLGLVPSNALLISMALIFGGATQLVVGLLEYKQGRSFSGITFCAYGLYWLSFVGIALFPILGFPIAAPVSALGCYFLLWAIFTTLMTIIAQRLSHVDFIIFLSLSMLYYLLAVQQFLPMPILNTFSSLIGITCGLSAFYLAVAKILNHELGYSLLPIGKRVNDSSPQLNLKART